MTHFASVRKLAASALLTSILLGCEQLPLSSDKIEETYRNAKSRMESLTPKRQEIEGLASEEVEKLFTIEYRVEEFPRSSSALEIEQGLATLGRDRWECFHVEAGTENYQVFCRRRSKSYLRYLGSIF